MRPLCPRPKVLQRQRVLNTTRDVPCKIYTRKLVSWSLTSLFSTKWLYQRRTVTVYRGHHRALCFPARDYLLGHHVHRNYLR